MEKKNSLKKYIDLTLSHHLHSFCQHRGRWVYRCTWFRANL